MTAQDDLNTLKMLASADQKAQIDQLVAKFGPDAALKITGNLSGQGGSSKDGAVPPAANVKALLQDIQGKETNHPDPKRDAMEAALQNAVKADPTFIDRLETQLAANKALEGKIASRFMTNPDGVKDKLNDLIKSDNIEGLMEQIPAQPAAAPVVVAGGNGQPAKPAASPVAKPFNETDELKKIQPQATQDAVKAAFENILKSETIKPEFDKLQDDQKRHLIKNLADGAADKAFLGNVNDLVTSSPQLIALGMDSFANDTQNAVKEDLAKKKDQGTTPAPAADNNPFSGMLSSLFSGPIMGRIMGVLSGFLNMIVGFFENMLGGSKSGVSNNGFDLTRQAGATPPLSTTLPPVMSQGAPRQPAPGG